MTARLTAETHKVCWELADIWFNARLFVHENGEWERWNGWLCPALDRDEIERLIAWSDKAVKQYPELSTFEWDGDVLIEHLNAYPGDEPERLEPVVVDGQTYWSPGAWSWTWQRVVCGCGHEWHDSRRCTGTGATMVYGPDEQVPLDEACICKAFVGEAPAWEDQGLNADDLELAGRDPGLRDT